MLIPNSIPSKEPVLRVGIVLPGDRFTEIQIVVPETPKYRLSSPAGYGLGLAGGDKLHFRIDKSAISVTVNGESITNDTADFWKIEPGEKFDKIGNKSGLKVCNVVAGRGFHWVKNIDVFLTGSVELSIVESVLMVANELPIEHYLMCVATSEMGAACPPALIESQTIVARSWMLANVEMKHRDLNLDVCNDDCCQRYQGTTFLNDESVRGAMNTFGKVLISDGKICDARYFKSCGGITEGFEHVFGDEPVKYLQPVIDASDTFSHPSLPLDTEEKVRNWIFDEPETFCSPGTVPEKELINYLGSVDVEGKYFRWRFRYTQKEMTALLNLKLNLAAKAILKITPLKRGFSGRITRLEIRYCNQAGEQMTTEIEDQYNIRQTLHELFLYSSAFVVDVEAGQDEVPKAFNLIGAGWGHGVGYCQIGALGMALKGYSAEEIVLHYYPGSKLQKIY